MKNKVNKKDLRNRLVAIYEPSSGQAEYFRTLKTNIDMVSLDINLQSLLITSPTQDSGKTMIASNLAATYAQYDKKILLMDLDLRKPSMGYTFPQTRTSIGLSGLLDVSADFKLEDAIVQINDTNLYALPVGVKIASPHTILNSKRLEDIIAELKEQFDMIIIDTPPILAVTDALVLSKFVDRCVMVVKNNYSRKDEVKKSINLLSELDSKYLGVVFNNAEMKEKEYYYYGESKE
ncbi:CpsD/CapB family tyrosine-protein kinase [Listeria kieliensis]|uniref:non-specific protein-tyrosine kinase n=1 Tax=Listeria kieliensis TaxID=1621700 RepID=A0A3D8TQS6_9LIST|nr:CpsD/CapB family tyrosine-protein kinase [Listeria kieliensis]RDX01238.1 capsule biosynthesis protein [Listeria kieliensis]